MKQKKDRLRSKKNYQFYVKSCLSVEHMSLIREKFLRCAMGCKSQKAGRSIPAT